MAIIQTTKRYLFNFPCVPGWLALDKKISPTSMSVCDMATVFMDITRDIFFNKNLNAIIIKYWPCSYWQYQCLTVKRCSFKVMKLSTAHLNGTCPKRSMSAFSVNRILLFPFLILNYDRF